MRPWDGITVEDLRLEPNRTVSFQVGPRRVLEGEEIGPIDYPDSYEVSAAGEVHPARSGS